MNTFTKICISYASDDAEIAFRIYTQLRSTISEPDAVHLACPEADFRNKKYIVPADITHLVVLCSNTSANSIAVSLQIEKFLEKLPRLNVLPVKLTRKSDLSIKEIMPSALLLSMGKNHRLHKQKPPEFIAEIVASNPDYADVAKKIIAQSGLKTKSSFIASKVVSTAIAASVFAVLAVSSITLNNSVKRLSAEADSANLFANTVIMELEKGLPKDVQAKHLANIGDAAISALSVRPIKALSDDELSRRAKLLHIVGNAHDLIGEPDKAITAFQLANSLTKELTLRFPNDNKRLFEHSQSAFWLGNVSYQVGDLSKAKEAFSAYKKYSEILLSKDPENMQYKAEVAYSLVNYGIIELESGNPKIALSDIQHALSLLDQNIIDAGFATKKDHAHFLGWLADTYLELGEFTNAQQSILQQKNIYEELGKVDPSNTEGMMNLANALSKLADIEIDNGEADLALTYLDSAIDLMKYATEKRTANIKYRTTYLSAIQKSVDIKQATGNVYSAKLLIDESRRFRADNDLNGANDRRTVENAWMNILSAKVALQMQDADYALREVTSALLELERAKNDGLKRKQVLLLGNAEFIRGLALEQSGQYGEAKVAWRSVIATLKGGNNKNRRRVKDILSRSLWKLGRKKEAEVIYKELLASSYKHPEFIAFWKQQSGTNNVISRASKRKKQL